MLLRLTDEAWEEFQKAYAGYREINPELAEDFRRAAREGFAALRRSPMAFGRVRGTDYRRFNLRRFPYYLPYRVVENRIIVVAVAHNRRRPGYWQRRE